MFEKAYRLGRNRIRVLNMQQRVHSHTERLGYDPKPSLRPTKDQIPQTWTAARVRQTLRYREPRY